MTAVFYLCVILFLGFANVTAKESAAELSYKPSPKSEFRLQLKETIETMAVNPTENSSGNSTGLKSVKKSVLFSALVPGTGQIYANSYIKGFLFLGVEVAAIVLNRGYDSKANDFEDEYETLADAKWNEDFYWDWIAKVSGRDRENLAGLREWEHESFSHFLPNVKNQQYYENVGKYNQFVYGWEDFREYEAASGAEFTFVDYQNSFFNGQNLGKISETRSNYVQIRKVSNDNFKKATTMSTIIMFNHVLSAIDAGLTTKFRNDKITAELNMQGKLYYEELVPVLALGVHW